MILQSTVAGELLENGVSIETTNRLATAPERSLGLDKAEI